jgi:SEC-C motif-containing protein
MDIPFRRPGRNDVCWCGSGEKYKQCHLGREDERQLPHAAVSSTVLRQALHKECLHPEASPARCDRIISAHTVQRARVLKELIDSSQHLLQFAPTRRTDDDLLPLRRIGWRDASTFSGFCATHDAKTFAPVETQPFQATGEQCFLLSYRALCHEIYVKRLALRAHPELRRLNDRGLPLAQQVSVQNYYDVATAGTRRGLADFERIKALMDRELLAGDYRSWVNVLVYVEGPLSVATAGIVSPNRDLDGNVLQSLSGPEQQPLFCNVALAESGGVLERILKTC